MKKIVPLFITSLALSVSAIALSVANKEVKKVKATSDSASIIFGHGVPEVDLFYNYCPTVMEESDGTRHVYYCTNTVAGNVTDYIGYRKGTLQGDGSYSYSSESIVLSPTADKWDSRHTCDPNIIKGTFTYNSHNYSYLLAYLGCVTSDNSHNEIGLAVSDNPEGPFTKVDALNPFKHFAGTSGYEGWEWGYGQASMISIDKQGQVLFTYTVGEKNGTYVNVEKWNFSNLNSPSQIGATTKVFTNGLKKVDGTSDPTLNNVDFAYDEVSKRIYAIRDNHPNATLYPDVATNAQILYVEPHKSDTSIGGNLYKFGTWKLVKELNKASTDLDRNHNCCLVRDEYGHLNNPSEIECIITDGYENSENNWWQALSTYRLYSYKVTVNSMNSDYMLDVGANITYNYTEELDIPAFRIMPQSQDFSSGNAIAIRIRENHGTDTPLRISFNCTSNYRKRALINEDESKKYYLVNLDGTYQEYPYRTWDGDVWLKNHFDGYLVMLKDDQVTDTTYGNEGTFTWSSIYATYFALETHYDSYADYDIGDMYTCTFDSGLSLVRPILQCGLVSETNTSNTFVLDYLGESRININRNNPTFISVVELVDKVLNINPCSDSSTTGYKAYPSLLSSYQTISLNGTMLDYFNSVEVYDYVSGDTGHIGNMTNKVSISDKLTYIGQRYSGGASTNIMKMVNTSTIMVVIIAVSITSTCLFAYILINKKKRK